MKIILALIKYSLVVIKALSILFEIIILLQKPVQNHFLETPLFANAASEFIATRQLPFGHCQCLQLLPLQLSAYKMTCLKALFEAKEFKREKQPWDSLFIY